MHHCFKVLEAWALCMIVMYVTESDKIMSSSIDSYCTRVFLLQNCHLKTFIHYRQPFIDWYTMIHRYIDPSILNLQYWHTHCNIMHHYASVHHSIILSLLPPMSDHSKLYINKHENGYHGSIPLRYGTVHYPSTYRFEYSNCTVNPTQNLEETQEVCFHYHCQAHLIHHFTHDKTPSLTHLIYYRIWVRQGQARLTQTKHNPDDPTWFQSWYMTYSSNL